MSVFAKQSRRYARLTNQGDQVSGTITNISEPRQSIKYDPRPGAPKQLDWWESTDGGPKRPKLEVVLTLQTELNEGPDDSGEDDDGQRLLVVPVKSYKPGNLIYEIQAAMLAAGGKDIEEGAWLGVRNVGTDPESQNPDNPRKMYQAAYKRPQGGGGLFAQGAGQQQAPAAQPQQAPVQQPAPSWQQNANPGYVQQPPAAGFQQGGYTGQQPQQAQQPAWQPPQQVNTGTGEVGGGVPATDPWGAPQQAPAAQAAQQWQPPAEPPRDPAMYQQPANPTPQQQQAAQAFNGGQSNQNWQPPAPQQAAPPVQQVDTGAIRALIQQGAPDGYIMQETGASLEAITAIRNI